MVILCSCGSISLNTLILQYLVEIGSPKYLQIELELLDVERTQDKISDFKNSFDTVEPRAYWM